MKLFQLFSHCVAVMQDPGSNPDLQDLYEERLEKLEKLLPSGSGFDAGTHLLLDESTADKLVFEADFHHRNENRYTGWTSHIVYFSVDDKRTSVTGPDKAGIIEYIKDTFHDRMMKEVDAQAIYGEGNG